MTTVKKHPTEHLDGTKGSWRPALTASSILAADGQPGDYNEIVVMSCPACGAPQGIGGDDVKIVNGKTDRPWTCYDVRCKHREDVLEFVGHQEPAGREHFGKLKAEAHQGVFDARIRNAHLALVEKKRAELHDDAMAQVKAEIGDGTDPVAVQKFLQSLKAKSVK